MSMDVISTFWREVTRNDMTFFDSIGSENKIYVVNLINIARERFNSKSI